MAAGTTFIATAPDGTIVERTSKTRTYAFAEGVDKFVGPCRRGAHALAHAPLDELVGALHAPRTVWVMVPAGDITRAVVRELADREQLPTNRLVAPSGRLAARVRAHVDRYGFDAAMRRYRFSRPKLKSVLAS